MSQYNRFLSKSKTIWVQLINELLFRERNRVVAMETIHHFFSVFRFKTDSLNVTKNTFDLGKMLGRQISWSHSERSTCPGKCAQPGSDLRAWPGFPGGINVERCTSVSPGLKSTWQRHKRSTSLNLKLPTLPSHSQDLMPQRWWRPPECCCRKLWLLHGNMAPLHSCCCDYNPTRQGHLHITGLK